MDDAKALFETYKTQRENHLWATDLIMLISRVSTNYELHYNKQHAEFKVTNPSASVLYALLEKGGRMTQKQLTNKLPVTKQAITAALKVLEKRGLISREIHTGDRRKRWVTLTEEGLDLIRWSLPLRNSFYDRLMKCITEDEARVAADVLVKMNKFYEKETRALARRQAQKAKL